MPTEPINLADEARRRLVAEIVEMQETVRRHHTFAFAPEVLEAVWAQMVAALEKTFRRMPRRLATAAGCDETVAARVLDTGSTRMINEAGEAFKAAVRKKVKKIEAPPMAMLPLDSFTTEELRPIWFRMIREMEIVIEKHRDGRLLPPEHISRDPRMTRFCERLTAIPLTLAPKMPTASKPEAERLLGEAIDHALAALKEPRTDA